ncbi:medium-chain acyl-CoA ligase ACSF2%2C mitochondrial [Xyrichtys novacula]|uniref:Medium-chain acyl-CoA ligase ACSF2, mitochondrial n=1 Tax=Xyrichtys novacula TaxID=13765 RepID=A0AAV1H5R0_XYRNO|nr:medium-chain acyl-CoA ligase ACSF2%2C mitochondrial [Xyrichtys novacula]
MFPKIVLFSRTLRNPGVVPGALRVLQRPWTRRSGLPAASRGIHVDSPPTIPTLTTSYAHGTSSFPLVHYTMAEALQRTVERVPDKEAMVFVQDGVRKTFAQFQQDVDRAAAGLLALGLTKGDRLGMWGPNTYEWILMQFATAKAGIIMVAVNPAYQQQEVEFALRQSGCKAVVCLSQFKTQKYCDMLRRICPEIETSTPGDIRSTRLPELRAVIVLDSRQPGMLHFEDVMEAGSSQYVQQLQDLQRKISFDDPINILFTSGTTGTPKGATLSHHNIVNNGFYTGLRVGYAWRPNTRICIPVPLYHCFGSVGGGVCMAVHGISLVFPSTGYDGKANLAAMESERCNFIYGTPTMYVDLLSQPDFAKYDLSTVEAGIMAGSPCPSELVKKLIAVGIKQITIGYGTTENSPVTFCASPLDNLERKSETCGYIMDHLEAKIVDPSTGEVVPLGTLGEIMIRGYCVMLEYWGDKAKTRECITAEGWYKTGDIGSMDAYSYLKIEGRMKDMIIRGGENVYPAEIEQFLHTHPKVKEAQIAHFKIPRYILFVTTYPLTVTGKIQKNKLVEVAKEQLGLVEGK